MQPGDEARFVPKQVARLKTIPSPKEWREGNGVSAAKPTSEVVKNLVNKINPRLRNHGFVGRPHEDESH